MEDIQLNNKMLHDPGRIDPASIKSSSADKAGVSGTTVADDHVKLGRELDLFMTDPTIGRGLSVSEPWMENCTREFPWNAS